jgi:hypothetical protein
MENTSKNFFETMTEMQKKVVENFTGATENLQKNFFQTNFMESDPFKKWYDSQMSFFNQKGDSKTESNAMGFFNSWIENQTNQAKTWFDQVNNATSKFKADINSANPSSDMFNKWMETVNNTYSEMSKSFSINNDAKGTFSGLFNNSQNYMKMFELWMPMLKSIQNKSFTPESFKQMFNAQLFKNMMDNVFNMQPDFMKNMNNDFTSKMKESFGDFSKQTKGYYDTFSQNIHSNLNEGNKVFGQFTDMYNQFTNSLNQAVSPLMKLMSPGDQKDQLNSFSELSNDFNHYNILNAQMQYMMYVTGIKAMEQAAENIYNKMNSGEDMSDFTAIYQEWLNINDKNFVTLFDSDDYSKMQSELNAYGMKIKQKMNLQMEKSLAHLPLINRTEMDELYKSFYDLKKQMTEMQKAFKAHMASVVSTPETSAKKETSVKEETTAAKPAATKASAKKA